MSALDGLCSRCGEDPRQGRSTLCHSCLADNAAKASVTRAKKGSKKNGWMAESSRPRRDTVEVERLRAAERLAEAEILIEDMVRSLNLGEPTWTMEDFLRAREAEQAALDAYRKAKGG